MNVFLIILSFVFVALGQPSWMPWLGILSSSLGYGLFWKVFREISSLKQRIILAVLWYSSVQAVQFSWMTSTKYQGIFILLVYFLVIFFLGCQFGLASSLLPVRRDLKWIDVFGIASFWVLMEWSRLFFLCGLSLNFSGMALSSFFIPMQIVSIFGVLGLSFYVLLTNLVFLKAIEKKFSTKKVALWLALASFPYLFGFSYIKLTDRYGSKGSTELSIALVQTDLAPSEKVFFTQSSKDFILPFEQWRRILTSLKKSGLKKADLIVTPEAALPYGYDRPVYELTAAKEILSQVLGPDIEKHFPKLTWPNAMKKKGDQENLFYVSNAFFASTIASYFGAELIIGLDYEQREFRQSFNSAFHFIPNAAFQKRYDKEILVPMGEYLPYTWCEKIAEKFGLTEFFSSGQDNQLFQGKVPIGVSICYEETFPKIMRKLSKEGALLFVNLTNDGWYPNTNLFKQHLYHARVRAAENGVPHVRACNGGVSAFIDSFGKIILKLEKGEKTLHSTLPIKTHFTLYQIWGDALILGICLFCGVLLILSRCLSFFEIEQSYNFNKSSMIK